MQTQFIAPFIAAVKNSSTPIPVDFVSTHFYPTDPECQTNDTKGDPDCFTHTVLAAQKLARAADLPFFITECGFGRKLTVALSRAGDRCQMLGCLAVLPWILK